MGENWLNDMAFAVENAWVVLSCVSLNYKDSENCKLGKNLPLFPFSVKNLSFPAISVCDRFSFPEAHYAKKCKIPIIPLKVEKWNPDGWLGILIASLMYYDFTKEDSKGTVMAKLIVALRQKRDGKDKVDGEPAVRSFCDFGLYNAPGK